ncbi:MAG: hydroxymethylbilane synthase [Kiritimatiellae bacterium]|nr:hydroxymethylbilane synthase [Kiritimatiellia bacterium]MDW8457908.1 hydroxymethylbilane synthase [Verrucomicrobiota bacterium]
MDAPRLIVISRGSRLARVQTEEALQAIRPLLDPRTHIERATLDTPGDRDLQTPLTDPRLPDDFFTRDLDRALLEGRADIAVHSAKDLPQRPVPGLAVAALLPARDIREALVVRHGVDPENPAVIGTSSPRRESETRKLFPHAVLKPLRGSIEQRLQQLDRGEFDAVIMAACALERLGLSARIARFLPFEPVPQQGRLAIVVREDRKDLLKLLRAVDVRRTAGLVAIVGCPAAFDLISHRAERYLERAEVILHDRLVPDEILSRYAGRLVFVGKTGGGPSTPQFEIHRRMLHEAEAGKLVVRLHGGDPGIYGHLGEEIEFLTNWNIRFDVVPAPTAAQLAAARAHAPLTHRGHNPRITLATARPGDGFEDAPFTGPEVGPLAIYMGVLSAAEVAQKLREAGWPDQTDVLVAERIGYHDERIRRLALSDLPQESIDTPATFLVGLRAFPPPRYTLFTGTDPDHFLEHGPLLHWPMIRLEALSLEERAARLTESLARVRGILFPSRFAVRAVMEALLSASDVRALAGKTLLAVGPSTAADLRAYGLRADGAADHYGGIRSLRDRLPAEPGGVYLYPCSDAAPLPEREEALRERGVELLPVIFYRNVPEPPRPLPRLPFTRVIFTSTSTVRAYFERYPDERRARREWLAVGPSTLRALQELGLDAESLPAPRGAD